MGNFLKAKVQDLHEDDPAQIERIFQYIRDQKPIYAKLNSRRYSAICTVLVAAPFLRLSATIHILRVLGWDSSLLNRPTNTSSFLWALMGMGYILLAGSSCTTTPLALESNALTSSRSKSVLNSTFTDSAWPPITGILTVVAVTCMEGSLKIFFVSLIIFISSLV